LRVRVLGSAAGGGFPQWNCRCGTCEAARVGVRARPRTQSSLAIRGAEGPWFLVNASPDLRQQLETLHTPVDGIRAAPIAGVLLTDAEIDHTAGLLLLRESPVPIQVYGDAGIERVLRPTLLRMLDRFSGVEWHALEGERTLEGLDVELFRDDLARLGISQRTAADMGHVPLTDSLAALAGLQRPRVVLVHINNTNPILLEDSPEREQVVRAGVEVAYDGLEVEL
jgi:phosphoribosyl 1,2-cyclic phosphodiesterase